MTDTTTTTQAGDTDARALREKAVAAKQAVAELAGEVKNYAADRLGLLKDRATDKFHDGNETVVEFIKRNPYKALAIAAGIGLAAGWLLKRR